MCGLEPSSFTPIMANTMGLNYDGYVDTLPASSNLTPRLLPLGGVGIDGSENRPGINNMNVAGAIVIFFLTPNYQMARARERLLDHWPHPARLFLQYVLMTAFNNWKWFGKEIVALMIYSNSTFAIGSVNLAVFTQQIASMTAPRLKELGTRWGWGKGKIMGTWSSVLISYLLRPFFLSIAWVKRLISAHGLFFLDSLYIMNLRVVASTTQLTCYSYILYRQNFSLFQSQLNLNSFPCKRRNIHLVSGSDLATGK